ncbi:MAG: hypothetical protein M1402_02650 [Candidatus Thermoplasmatota archaeon]|nr:hypothetical protein [Candidatus Thermoplasmatota archaeon]MCL5665754.1 hypothetical protein [Candidatus Thermoplasmatota archaeon]
MRKKSERLLTFFDKYREKNLKVPIIVEGKRDISSLRKLDFRGEIILLNTGKSLMGKAEIISEEYKEVIILTDFDRKGVFLKNRIVTYLMSLGIQADLSLWNYVSKNMPARTVEQLPWAYDTVLTQEMR